MEKDFHPIAHAIPLMGARELEALALDIDRYGLHDPIVLFEGKILDGRSRYLACMKADMLPTYIEYRGADATGFVVGKNLSRRNLTVAQRALIAAELVNMRRGDNQHSPNDLTSQAQAAQMCGVSISHLKRALPVVKTGIPQLIAAVREKKIPLTKAAQIAILSPQEQDLQLYDLSRRTKSTRCDGNDFLRVFENKKYRPHKVITHWADDEWRSICAIAQSDNVGDVSHFIRVSILSTLAGKDGATRRNNIVPFPVIEGDCE